MIAATDDGVLMDTNRSWSIDDKRLNFQFGCEIGWEINERPAGAHAAQPHLHGHRPALLALDGHARRRDPASGGPGARPTAARASPARSATPAIRRAGPLQRRPGGGARVTGVAPGETRAAVSGAGAPEMGLDTAQRVLDLVAARAAGAEAEVTVESGVSALTRFANSFIHQNVAEAVNRISLRVALDGHVSAAHLDGRPGDEALRRLVDGALEAARVRPVDPAWPGVAPIAPAAEVDHWDEDTASATPGDRARRVRGFVDAAGGLETAGYCSTSAIRVVFANSAGQRLTGRATTAALDGIARTETSDGSDRAASRTLSSLDGRRIGEAAARRARDAAEPDEIDAGPYEVVLGPGCVGNLLDFVFLYGYNARTLQEGRSFVRLGEQQLDASIELRDDVTDPGQVGIGFDAEGTPRRRVDVVLDGVSMAVLHTRRTARVAGPDIASTGHFQPGAETWGAVPSNIVLSAGERSVDELVSSMKRGLLVTDFHYTRVLDPRTLVVTGLTRNGVWLVEDGRIVKPVRNLRFTQSFAEALEPGAVLGISRERTLLPGDWDEGTPLVPSLHLARWNFTGGARG